MRNINLALRFLLELTGVGVLAWSGYRLGSSRPASLALAVLAPALLVAVWAKVVAPKATNGLGPLTRMLIGSGLLLVCAAALGAAGPTRWAVGLAAVIVANTVALSAAGPPTVEG